MDEDEAPTLLNPDYPNLQAILAKADVVIHVIDARDPLAFRSSHLEELVKAQPGQKIMLVLNKIGGPASCTLYFLTDVRLLDTCPREAVVAWAAHLRTQHPTFIFRSASSFLPGDLQPQSKGKEKERADDAIGVSSILSCLAEWSHSDKPLVVAVTGVTNVSFLTSNSCDHQRTYSCF